MERRNGAHPIDHAERHGHVRPEEIPLSLMDSERHGTPRGTPRAHASYGIPP